MIRSRDLVASRDLYVVLLGFEVAMDEPGLLMLRSPSTPITQLIPIIDAAADQAALPVRHQHRGRRCRPGTHPGAAGATPALHALLHQMEHSLAALRPDFRRS